MRACVSGAWVCGCVCVGGVWGGGGGGGRRLEEAGGLVEHALDKEERVAEHVRDELACISAQSRLISGRSRAISEHVRAMQLKSESRLISAHLGVISGQSRASLADGAEELPLEDVLDEVAGRLPTR